MDHSAQRPAPLNLTSTLASKLAHTGSNLQSSPTLSPYSTPERVKNIPKEKGWENKGFMSPDEANRLNPLFYYSPEEISPEKERCGVTDRFIPTRKLMKMDSLWSEGEEDWAQ